ncbi:flagellar hook-basal body protein [Terrihalobacillus insolitus]|uniref:flagellar hook-basal body protein n=1 Tax=Terrihalobacillus insolitus TaxID=2950438 RepID=UPI00234136B4|nr:flagellar hook-basal body protein [Terrihalobacillus insolitus]MDC3411810.1 flagellar hook-basal body protein [Terrihalobacillus insolitus]
MLRGYYTAASGMIAQQRRQEVLSNNIANATTPGYKQDQGILRAFPELLIQKMGTETAPTARQLKLPIQTPIGSLNTGVYMQEAVPDFQQGSLKDTGIGTDMALVNGTMPDPSGSVFYTVQNETGDIRYTRNGNFTVDGQGYLVTNQGYYVLDQAGARISTDGLEFDVTDEGTVQTANQAMPLGISYSPNANDLVKEGNGLYQLANDGEAMQNARNNPNISFQVKQGFLEQSNVDPAKTMTDMMEAYRSFEASQRVLKAYDQSMEKTVNQIARLR